MSDETIVLPRLSTTTFQPALSTSPCATVRAARSVLPARPVVSMRMGRTGQAWPQATSASRTATMAGKIQTGRRGIDIKAPLEGYLAGRPAILDQRRDT